jgi:hypothetical protein
MPLHDWSELSGWEGVHDVWIVELLRAIKPQLPDEYRAYIGSAPALAIGATSRAAGNRRTSLATGTSAGLRAGSVGRPPPRTIRAGRRDCDACNRSPNSRLRHRARAFGRGRGTRFAAKQGSARCPCDLLGPLSDLSSRGSASLAGRRASASPDVFLRRRLGERTAHPSTSLCGTVCGGVSGR